MGPCVKTFCVKAKGREIAYRDLSWSRRALRSYDRSPIRSVWVSCTGYRSGHLWVGLVCAAVPDLRGPSLEPGCVTCAQCGQADKLMRFRQKVAAAFVKLEDFPRIVRADSVIYIMRAAVTGNRPIPLHHCYIGRSAEDPKPMLGDDNWRVGGGVL